MAPALPIKFTELLQLTSAPVNVDQQSIGFNSCTLESDSFICVREKKNDAAQPEVIIIDLKNNNNVMRRPIKADSAIMHWTKQVIALKAQQRTLQIFDLGAKAKLKSTTMNEDVVFWKWFSETSLGLVTETAVYHWDVFDPNQPAPVEVFKRNQNLVGCQIINYRVGDDGKWMVVIGITQQQGRVVGAMQLYSRDRGISQAIEGHAAAFGTLRLEASPADTKLFTFAVRTATGAKLHIVEVDHQSSNPVFAKKAVDVYFPAEAVNDFPVAMQVSQKYSIIYLVTKYGFIHLYDLETGTCIFMNRISSETIFITASDSESSGIVGINRKGQVLSVAVDETTIIPYLLQNPANSSLAVKLASRAGLPGADNLYAQQFDQLLSSGNYGEAAKIAANSPRGFLRTAQTIERFKSLPAVPGQLSVILQYFGMLLDKGTLNKHETLELVRPVLAQQRKHLLEKWLKENKLDCSEELGDVVRPHDLNLALSIYLRANVSPKVVAALAETGQFEKILPYATQAGYQPDYVQLLQNIVRINPEKGAEFATQLANNEGGSLVDIERVVDVFQAQGMVQPATAFLLDALKDNKPEQGHLQTRLLEMNLINAPQVADAILGNDMFSHYDRPRIAQLCEQAGLFQRALEHYDDPEAIKRVMINIVATPNFSQDWLTTFFGRLSLEQSLDCLDAMLKSNIRQNLGAVVQIATKYSDLLGPTRLIDLFEKYKTAEGLFYYLGSIVNLSEDPDVNFKYIEAATKMSQFTEVERICRDSRPLLLIDAVASTQHHYSSSKLRTESLRRSDQKSGHCPFSARSSFLGLSWTAPSKMASKASNILEYVVGQVWSLLTLTPARRQNPIFNMILSTRDVVEQILADSLLVFAPGLLDVVRSPTPPSVAYFKSLPTDVTKHWAVYLLVLEKPGCGPKIYIGSGTGELRGVVTRFYHYDNKTHLPRYIQHALDDGYMIVHKGLLCWCPIPTATNRFVVRAIFLAVEAVFSIVLCAMRHQQRHRGIPSLGPWAREDVQYDGCCTHSSIAEYIPGQTDALTPEQTVAKEVEMKHRRLQQKQIYVTNTRDTKKYFCDICQSTFTYSNELVKHKATKKHINNAAGVIRVVKAPGYDKWASKNIASRKHHCSIYFFNPEKVKNFLKEAKLTEQLPLIIVCDRFNFIHDLVLYLYQNQQFKSIEVYVQRVNPARTPAVVGGLLDVDCDESIIKNLLQTVNPASIPIDELVAEVESRNRLKLLLPFLEATLAAGNQQQAVYNALAKIYIDSNNNPEKFLKENDNYDPLTVGKYCEKRDPNLAYIAYRKGQNDLELVNITNENSMFKAQSRYILERADRELWSFVLSHNNIHRRSVVDQVISTAVPESTEPDKVSVAVASFLQADLPGELIELLEKIVLEPSPFSDNENLQNLLILTATKADKARVMDYIHRLDAYNAPDIANICIEVGLFEEAFEVYKKINDHKNAANVLVEHVVSIDRAQEYAERVELPEVWSRVAKAQLDGLRVTDSIASYIRAEDPSNYNEVIEIATHAGKDEDLIKFLRMARKTLREPPIDTALAFAFARTDQLSELEDFLRGTNVADIEESGDKAYAEGYHQAAKIFYSSISNWAKLATTLVHLEDYQAAVECARKANNIKVWKQVNAACVDKKEFRLAQICGLNLIVDAEELQGLVKQYERNGYFDELIALLEQGLGLERAHMGMFTELGIALSRYHPDRVMEHLKLFWGRINIPKMIRACEEAHLWPELVFLYCHYDEWDNAALAMMERAADAWEHHSFKDIVVKVANLEIYYRALSFYLQQQPSLLTDLLQALTPRIDVNRVVKMFEKSDNIPLIKPFLLNVQSQNKKTVNSAINDLLIEEEDYKTLRDSVENYDNYDPVELAQRLEHHDLVFFRQIAANIYRKNKRWEKSIALSKQDKLFKDAIETAAMSGKSDVVDELLRYFVDIGSRECYVGMLYACYDLIPVATVMEISWRHGLTDYTMPFMINYLAQQSSTIEMLKKDNEERKSREKSQETDESSTPILGGNRLMITAGPGGRTSPAPFAQTNGFAPQQTGYSNF
ncbi:Clathrin heavy chain [Venustampulla echinocandica]|uniref:Clathrin heavy chain n=1 Tax=Venustampulla echinocandica TaxID=2656787 RepID=A0A370TMD6_9HELO|nr:Clathrin heavy chain [Venustampulla echinocandica]RDL36686.1 Clathrin heavy chain [Venustampulla echinocandica]